MISTMWLKQLFCKHNYKPWANVHGDAINDLKFRTVLYCTKCGKFKYVSEYIPAPIDYVQAMAYLLALKDHNTKKADKLKVFIVKDWKMYKEYFGQERFDDFGLQAY